MTLPVFKAAGTLSETAPAWPTHAAGDFGMLFVETSSGTITTPSGWSFLGFCDNPGFAATGFAFWRFATSSSESAPTLSGGAGDHKSGVIVTYTGVNTSTPVHCQTVGWGVSGTGQSIPGVTTLVDDCLVVQFLTWGADNAGPLASGEANSSLASLAERFDGGTTTGGGGGIVVYDGQLASHGLVTPTSLTLSAASSTVSMAFALQAADKQLPILDRKSRAVNTGM